MFLEILKRRNPNLIKDSLFLYDQGLLEADTYVVDMDVLRANAQKILNKANEEGIELYFMLKQLGRNPIIAKELVEMGYAGAVVVDFREAQIMMENGIPLGNVGHLVQVPQQQLEVILSYGTEVVTVFTYEKLQEVNAAAKKLGLKQDVLIKVAGADDLFYSGQEAGIELDDLDAFLKASRELKNIQIVGSTSFPCFLYDEEKNDIAPTPNLNTVLKSIEILKDSGCEITQINLPSTTSVRTLNLLSQYGGTHGEPGHGFTGSTPAHAKSDLEELPAILYLSEVSHNFREKSYVYGGGHYRRSHVKEAFVRKDKSLEKYSVKAVEPSNIDYYFELDRPAPVSAPVIMSFRFQIFVTRSKVALIERVEDEVQLIATYDSLGRRIS